MTLCRDCKYFKTFPKVRSPKCEKGVSKIDPLSDKPNSKCPLGDNKRYFEAREASRLSQFWNVVRME